jgi:hypothetical protein
MQGAREKGETRKVGRPPMEMPEPINDTPENVAKAILSSPSKKRGDWKFMREHESGKRSVVKER